MNRLLVLCVAALALAGCQSHPFSLAVSPRLTGRVVAADTGKPIASVRVLTCRQAEDFNAPMPPKGGERLMTQAAVRTDRDGRFLLETERVLTPFRGSGWFAVHLAFEHAGYERFLTNYSYLNLGTNSWKGEAVLDAGRIRLHPLRK